MKEMSSWLQATVTALFLLGAIIAFGVHVKDGVSQNREVIQEIHTEVKDIDDTVHDNQQRLAHIEALISGQAHNIPQEK